MSNPQKEALRLASLLTNTSQLLVSASTDARLLALIDWEGLELELVASMRPIMAELGIAFPNVDDGYMDAEEAFTVEDVDDEYYGDEDEQVFDEP